MNEDPTQKLPDSLSFEDRVLAELAAIRSEQAATRRDIAALSERTAALETRLTSLEEKVDARLRETRPIWESMQQQLTEVQTRMAAMEKTLDLIRVALGELYGDSIAVRARIRHLEELQRTPAG